MTFNHIFLLGDNSFCSIPSLHSRFFRHLSIRFSLSVLLLRALYWLCRLTYHIFFSMKHTKKRLKREKMSWSMLALGKLDFIYRFFITVYSLFPISTKIFIKRDNCPFFRLLRIYFDATCIWIRIGGSKEASKNLNWLVSARTSVDTPMLFLFVYAFSWVRVL